MKVKLKKTVDHPPEIKAFTEKVLALPLDRIAEGLTGFTWKYEKGDFYHWVPLFNHFDAFFDHHIRDRADLGLHCGKDEDEKPFPTVNTLAVLRVTASILENCTNKHLYQSYEHLTDLLAAPEPEVVVAALQALVAFLRKTHHASVRFHGYPQLNARLFDMCRGWGGKEEGLDLVACVNGDESQIKAFIPWGTGLHFEFYAESRGSSEASGSQDTNSGSKVIRVANLDKVPETDLEILRNLVKKHRVPYDMCFRLLTRIRIAHGFGSLEGRRHLVRVRLLAFCVLFQSNPLHEELLSFFISEPEFMNELVGLVQAEEGVPLELRTIALRALAVQLVDRSRHSAVINAIGVGGQNGVLSILLQDSITYISSRHREDSPPKYSASFVEALLSLVGALVSSSSGSVALSEAGFIPALLPLIQDEDPGHASLVCTAVKILEAFMDFSSSASAMFRGLGGLTYMIKRLESEVAVVSGGATEAKDPGPGPSQSSDQEPPKQIPYIRRLLLKSLLRAIALASYAPTSGTGTRPDDSDAQMLYTCLKSMFLHAKDFGGALFALAASVVTDLIHHDPLCFRSLHEVGVPAAFLKAVKEGVIPSSEAVCCVTNTLVALCLNSIGLEAVKETHALDCLVTIFTSKKYLRALSGDTASILGAGIDELLRHVPALKEEGIEVVIAIFNALRVLGGDPEAASPDSMETEAPKDAEPPASSGDVEMVGACETAQGVEGQTEAQEPEGGRAVPSQRRIPIPQEVLERSKDKSVDTTLPECISHATKMLESLLSNQDTSRRLVESGAIDLLLTLYRLPRMPPAFGSSSQSHTMLQIFRAITPNHSHTLPKKVKEALAAQLELAISGTEGLAGECVPTLEKGVRDNYVRLIASTSGLTGIAATVARNAMPMLAEICKGEKSLMSSLGQLERIVLGQLIEADSWKEEKERASGKAATTATGEAGPSGPASGSAQPQGDVAMGGTEEEGGQDTEGDADPDQMDVESVGALRPVGGSRLGGGRLSEGSGSAGSRSHRKKSLEDIAYEVLHHFVVAVRGFYTSVAKSIHTPARRREEPFSQPTVPMRAATLGLALVLKANLDFDIGACSAFNSRKAKHLSRLVEEVLAVLFDSRRHCCHTLILNYFVAVGGMASLARRFREAVNMLWWVVDTEKKEKSGEEAKSKAESSKSTFFDSVSHLANLLSGETSPMQVAEGVVLSFLGLFDQLTDPRLLCQSSQAASLLTIPLPSPEAGDSTVTPSTEAEAFIKDLQAYVVGCVLPVWSNPLLPQSSPQVTSSVISILNSCSAGTATVAAALRAGTLRGDRMGMAGRAPPAPDPAMVQQIVEMGFSQSRAEEALRRVGHNSVELAMEWLFNHPEDPSAPANQESTQPPAEDQALAMALAASLNEIDAPRADGGEGAAGPSSSTPSANSELKKVEVPAPVELVNGAISVLQKMPVSAFSLSDLLMTLCNRDNGKDRGLVVSHLVARLRGDAPLEQAVKQPSSQLNAAAHLLVMLLSESAPCREVASEKNILQVVLDMLEAWEANYKVALSAAQLLLAAEAVGDRECSAEDKKVPDVPMWVEALLLILDTMAQTQPKQPPASEPQTANQTQGQSATSGGQSGTQPEPSSRPEAQAPAERSGPSSVPGLSELLSTWQPCGLLSNAEHYRALQVCIRLLGHLHTYGKNWKLPTSVEGDLIAQPDPAATTQAVLQLMARLTRSHERALEVLHRGGVHLLLNLPAACLLPKHEFHISAILKHILEDSGTLQSYMEAEIKNLLTSRSRHNLGPYNLGGPFGSGTTCTMPIRTFLQNMATVINRDPSVFMEAVSSCCSIEESTGAHSHQAITLKKTKTDKSTSAEDTAKHHHHHHSKSKHGKRVIPVSFVEVIDKLLDVVLKFQPASGSAKTKQGQEAAKKVDTRPGGVAESGARGGAGVDNVHPLQQLGQLFLEGRTGGPSGERLSDSHILQIGASASTHTKDIVMNHRDLIMQVMVLRMLSEFCLMYTSTVGVLLKRDSETACRDGAGPSEGSKVPGLLKALLHSHLGCESESSPLTPGVSEETSRFLQAVCIRSAEGRKRIIAEVVATINEAVDMATPVAPCYSMPFVSRVGGPTGFKIKVFIDLLGSLLSASSGSSSSSRSPTQTSGLTIEMIRSMREAGVVSALTKALKLIEMEHPKAPKAINSIIKPLEVLTRSIPVSGKRGSGHGTSSQGAKPATGEGIMQRGSGGALEAGCADGGPNADRAQGEIYQEEHDVSEAGPQAIAEAERMMEDAHIDRVEAHMDRIVDDVVDDVLDDDDDDEDVDGDEEDNEDDMEEDGDEGLMHNEGLEGGVLEPGALEAAVLETGVLDNDDHDDEDDDEVPDHVVVDEEGNSEGMGDHEEGESERSRTVDDVLGEDEEEDIEDEDDDGEGSADMELDDGEDWDDEDSREYAEALDRIEGAVWMNEEEMDILNQIRGETSNVGRGYSRLQPHIRNMFGNLLGNFVAGGGDIRIERRGLRYRPPRFDRNAANNVPYHPSMGPSQHRLLMRPPVPPPNSGSSRSIGTLTEALMGQASNGGDGGFGWGRIALSGLSGDIMNSLAGEGDNAFLSLRVDDQLRPLPRLGVSSGGWQMMSGFGPTSVMDMEYRSGREAMRNVGTGSSSWLSGLQGTLEQHIVEMLRETPPQPPAQPALESNPQTEDAQTPGEETPVQPEAANPVAAEAEPLPSPPAPTTAPPVAADEHQEDADRGDDNDNMVDNVEAPAQVEGTQQDAGVEEQGDSLTCQPPVTETAEPSSTEQQPDQPVAVSSAEQLPMLTPEFVHNALQNTLRALASPDHSGPEAAQTAPPVEEAMPEPPPPADVHLEDEEMEDVQPSQERVEHRDGDEGDEGSSESEGDDSDVEEGQEGGAGGADDTAGDGGGALDTELVERAQAAGIDPSFLQALPQNLQMEVLIQHGVSMERPAPPPAQNQSTPAAPTGTGMGEVNQTPAAAGGNAGQQVDQVDPEFLAALPPDIREEVLETQRLAEQRRDVERRLTQGGPDDVANVVASLPEDIREEVLLYSGPDVLANLPPDLIAEGQRLRERHMRHVGRDHDDSMARNFFLRRLRQEREQGNARGGQRPPGAGARKDKRDELEGPPPLDLEALVTLVELLRLSQPIHRSQLQKLFLNLCSRGDTRKLILQLLLKKLKESSGVQTQETALEEMATGLDSQAPAPKGHGESFPVQPKTGSSSHLWPVTPPNVTRRILELLSYLARHQNSKVAEILLELHIPAADGGRREAAGKLPIQQSIPEPLALEVLLEMLGQPLCQRSVSTLEQTLHLLEVIMQCATNKAASATADKPAKQSGEEDRTAQGQESRTPIPDASDSNQRPETAGNAEAVRGASESAELRAAAGPDAGPSSVPSTSQSNDVLAGLHELPHSLLRWLPCLLGKRGLSDRAYRTCASVVKLLVDAAPGHQVFMLFELRKELVHLAEATVSTMQGLGASGMDGASSTANAVGITGSLILRILHAVESLVKAGKPDRKSEVVAPSESTAVVQQVAALLDPLWDSLSSVISTIESKITTTVTRTLETSAAAKILPPGAAQILPLVESFFVLCSAQGCVSLPTVSGGHESDIGRISSLDGRTSSGVVPQPSLERNMSAGLPSCSETKADGSELSSQPLMKFAECHRVMLNAFLRQTPALLEGSLGPLLRMPPLIDFDNKRLHFRSKVRSEERHYGTLRINVRREHVFEDSFHQLRHRTPEELRCKLSVQFTGEEGIDAGGVSREWYQVMSREIFNPNLALFVAIPEGTATFQPNPNSIIQNDRGVNHLDFFKFVGRIVGKALYDGQLVDVHFTRSFYKHMLNQPLTYEDLEAVDPEYYKTMVWMLEHDITEVLDQNFVAEVDFFGRKEVVELKEGGGKLKVTNENKREYVNLMTKHKMTTAIREQIKAFQEGFWELVPKDLIAIFNDNELELLISGLPEVDVSDLRANTEYSGYTAATPVIQWFWEVVEELNKEELALLLQFVTGTSKVPLDGFANLQGISGPQKFQIHKSYVDTDRLPSAHTCFNQLDLPEYKSKDQLRDRVVVAIHEGREGFSFG